MVSVRQPSADLSDVSALVHVLWTTSMYFCEVGPFPRVQDPAKMTVTINRQEYSTSLGTTKSRAHALHPLCSLEYVRQGGGALSDPSILQKAVKDA